MNQQDSRNYSPFQEPDEINPRTNKSDTLLTSSKELIWCTLAPECAPPNQPSCFQTIEALETHFAQRHAFVCSEPNCGCILHSQHFLKLHRKEFHDSKAMAAKENGESIYECLVPDCEKLSPTPNQRKRHLINDHSFDEKFFFSVIKYGISAQIRAWATQTTTAPSSTKAMLNKPTDAKPPGDSSIERSRSRSRIKPEKSALSSRTSGSRSHRDRDPSADGLMQLIHPVSINEQSNRRNQFSPGTPSFSESAHTSSSSRKTPLSATTTFDTSTSNSGVDGRDYPTDDDYEEEDDDEDDVLPDSSPERGVRFAEEVDIRLLSPVSRRYNGRRGGGITGRRKNHAGPSSGSNASRRGGGRTVGVHSDDEAASGRHRSTGENRQSAPRGRGRGRGRPPFVDRTQYAHGS